MVRDYKKKVGTRAYRNYSDENLQEAILKIKDRELTIREASRKYKISFGTLYNKTKGKHTLKHGGQPVFSPEQEIVLLEAIIKCSDWGFPLTMTDARMFIKHYLDRSGRTVNKFVNNIPGKDFVYLMLKRNRTIASQRIASNIKRARACLSRNSISEYFDNLKSTMEDVSPSNIFNYDESNLCDDPGKSKGIYRRGIKYPERIVNHTKSATSIMICGSADGVLLPPYIIYKSDCLWDIWCKNGPKGAPCCQEPCCSRGTRYARTKHGWIDAQTFSDWYELTFIPHAKRLPGKKVIIGDNLSSHINISVIKLSNQNDISFVCLPPNATHLCQPLDVAFFRPMKIAWRQIILEWKLTHPKSGSIPKDTFPRLLQLSLQHMNKDENIKRDLINGFAATGIYPVNKDKVLSKIPNPEESVDELQQRVSDSLSEYLQSQRAITTNTRRVKRTKIAVLPGKSVTVSSSSDSTETDTDSPEYNDTSSADTESILSKSTDELEITEENPQAIASTSYPQNIPELQEIPEMSMPQEIPEVSVPQEIPEATEQHLEIGRFILVKFSSGKNKKKPYRYLCCIDEVLEDDGLVVHGLKSINGKQEFRLVEDDISVISRSDIIEFLCQPILKRGAENSIIYFFDNDIDINEM